LLFFLKNMSKIGNKSLFVPENTQVHINFNNNMLSIKSILGQLNKKIFKNVIIIYQKNTFFFFLLDDKLQNKKSFGLFRNLCNNILYGVSNKFSKILIVNGIGYKFQKENTILKILIGFNHPIIIQIPNDIHITLLSSSRIEISGIDKDRIGFFAAKIRNIRPPEPYGGKGIQYDSEIVVRKIGKKDRKISKK
jgi:large subunit ribosomal protein L6